MISLSTTYSLIYLLVPVSVDGNNMDQGVRGAGGREHAAVRVGRAVRRAAVPRLLRRAPQEYPFARRAALPLLYPTLMEALGFPQSSPYRMNFL